MIIGAISVKLFVALYMRISDLLDCFNLGVTDIASLVRHNRMSFLMFVDKILSCKEWVDFDFTASEQEFYAQKGFTNEPGRCPECRAARKSQMNGNRNWYGTSAPCMQPYALPAARTTPTVQAQGDIWFTAETATNPKRAEPAGKTVDGFKLPGLYPGVY